MPASAKDLYGEFPIFLSFDDGHGQAQLRDTVGGFSDVTGLRTDTEPVAYRDVADARGHGRKIPGTPKFSTVTLRRGVVSDQSFSQWIKTALDSDAPPRCLRLKMLDVARNPVATFTLHNARLTGCVGAEIMTAGKGVAIEALSLTHEGIEQT
jgi:phage tail-like protein